MNPFSRLFSWFITAPPPDPDTLAGLRRVAALVDKVLVASPDFTTRLTPSVTHARAFCADLVDRLPPAVAIDRQGFATDPLVHALFASADDIGTMIAASAPVRDYLTGPRSWQEDGFFALMAARRVEKNIFGAALQGEIVARDVPQSLLQFSNQTLLLPAADPASARTAMLEKAFDSLLFTFTAHVEQARSACQSLRVERELERARQRIHPGEIAPFPARNIAALDERLQRQIQSLQAGDMLSELADFLMHPEQALGLDPVRLWVTRGGVIQEDASHDAGAALIHFMELRSRDRRHHLVLPVRIRYDEAREALARAREKRTTYESMLLF
jgi:hypothetical protein